MNNDKTQMLAEITGINDENKLLEIFEDSDDFEIRYGIVNLIDDDSILYEIFANENNPLIKSIALNRISSDLLDYDDFKSLDDYEKITYIENHTDESLFFKALKNDENLQVRMAAIYRINDMNLILKMAEIHTDYDTRFVLYKKLNGKSLRDEITGENLIESRINLVKNLDNKNFLKDIAINDSHFDVRKATVEKIKDKDILADIAKNCSYIDVRKAAVEKIKDKDILADIARNDPDSDVRIETLQRISDKDTLIDIAINDSDFEVKLSAIKKLNKYDFHFNFRNWFNAEDLRQLIDIEDESQLMDVAISNPSNQFLIENAINNITNPYVLFELYCRGSYLIQETALKKLVFGNVFSNEKIAKSINVRHKILSICDDDLDDIAINCPYYYLRHDAVQRISDENILIDVAKYDENRYVRKAAIEKIDNENVLADIARNDYDWNVRLEAVQKISDTNILSEISRSDSNNDVRKAAVEKIDDEELLAEIAKNDTDIRVKKAAIEKINDEKLLAEIEMNDSNSADAGETSPKSDDNVLAEIARNDPDWNVRHKAIQSIADENILIDIARNCSYIDVCIEAVRMIGDEDALIDIARNNPYDPVRENAVEMIDDKDVLAYIAKNDSDWDVRAAAVKNVDDEDVLVEILRCDPDCGVRRNALANIRDVNTLQKLLLENFGYFSLDSFISFNRDYNKTIYESIETDIYEDILDKISDESVLADMIHEKLFGDFRILIVRRLVSSDVLRNLALNDLDYRVRLEAVRNPNLCDEKTFAKIVQSDNNDAVRLEALRQIDDDNLLENILNDLNPLMRLHAFKRLGKDFELSKTDVAFEDPDFNSIKTIEDENVLYAIINKATSAPIRKYAFDKITDEHILADLVFYNREFMDRALNKITDNALLLDIALYCTDESAKKKAIKKIDDEEFLLKAVQNYPYNDISAYIVDRIRDESHLEIIAFNNSNPFNRKAAVNKIRSQDILISLGEVECEEMVCTAIVRKCRDNGLLEYIGLSNPCKTVRRYVGSVTDDDELLYKFALKEHLFDNRRELISRMTDEEYIIRLLKREDNDKVFRTDFEITDTDLLIDLAKNSVSYAARRYALGKIEDDSIILDFIYSSPFSSKNPKNESVWEGFQYNANDKQLCLSILANPNFTDMKMIEDFLIENEIYICGELYQLRNNICRISSIYRILLNCKSEAVRKVFKPKLEYTTPYERDNDENEEGLAGLSALFG